MGNNQSGGSGNAPKKKTAFNEIILGGLKSRSGKETSRWINDLTSDGVADLVVGASEPEPSLPPQGSTPINSIVHFVDRLFDLFQQYEVEFNRKISSAELAMETERPVISSELLTRMQGNDRLHFSGRIHIHGWSLLVRGNLQGIEGYILPSDHLIAFSGNESAYVRFFQSTPVSENKELKWSFNGVSITSETLPSLAKQLFGSLVQVSRGEASENTPFVFRDKQSLTENALQTPSTSNVFEDDGGHSLQQSEQSQPSPQPARRSTTTVAPDKEEPEMENKASVLVNTVGVGTDLTRACDVLAEAIENELASLTRAGAQAFEKHDLSGVENALIKTKKLKSMRDQMLATIEEWKVALQEQ